MPVTITPTLRVPAGLAKDIARGTDDMKRAVGKECVKILQSNRSRWPVDTGLSKRSFGWRYNQRKDLIQIINLTHYAVDVEYVGNTRGGYRPAWNTIKRRMDDLVAAANNAQRTALKTRYTDIRADALRNGVVFDRRFTTRRETI